MRIHMDFLTAKGVHTKNKNIVENREAVKLFKYKVHSAIYSWGDSGKNVKATHDVTKVAQIVLDDQTNKGILNVNSTSFKDPAPDCWKSFAIVVSIVDTNNNEVTRFCTCREGTVLDVKNSGVICYF